MGAPIIFIIELVVPLSLEIIIGGENWGSNRLSPMRDQCLEWGC